LSHSQSATCFVFVWKIAAAVGCAGLYCERRLGVSGGERLAGLISLCLASGQAADCFSGFVPPGGIFRKNFLTAECRLLSCGCLSIAVSDCYAELVM